MLFIDDKVGIDPDTFKSQVFMFHLYTMLITFGFFLLCIFLFKEETVTLFQRNESTWKNIKKVFKNPNGWRLVLAVSISNGNLILIASTINIIVVDQGFTSTLASVVVLLSTLSGLFASIFYNIIFLRKKNHSKNFVLMMTFGALTLFFGSCALYLSLIHI